MSNTRTITCILDNILVKKSSFINGKWHPEISGIVRITNPASEAFSEISRNTDASVVSKVGKRTELHFLAMVRSNYAASA
jgi:hypothetical protein